MISSSPVLKALKDSLPICFAYFPLGMVFGLLFENQGYYWLFAPLMSLLVFAGAVQFLALSMLEQGATLIALLTACLFVGLRNSFYSLGVYDRFKTFSTASKIYLGFALVDATYAYLLKKSPVPKAQDETYCVYLSLFIHAYWVLGTAAGALAGQALPQIKGLEFILTSLFAIFAIEQYLILRKVWPFFVGIVGWCLMQWMLPQYALLGSILFACFIFWFTITRGQKKHA